MSNICDDFDKPYTRLLIATSDCSKLCQSELSLEGVGLIARKYQVDMEELLAHLKLVGGFIVVDGVLKCGR